MATKKKVCVHNHNPQLFRSEVIKVTSFLGSLPPRALYVYLPPDYHAKPLKAYPVLYMHDGQNLFGRFEQDSYAGSWRADETADRLINSGKMRPCIIVGVSNGRDERLTEYLPNYACYRRRRQANAAKKTSQCGPKSASVGKNLSVEKRMICGRAEETVSYYRQIAAYVERRFRTLPGRENRATCGSSMGGLFSAYMAWEHADFAKHHALMSTSFWMTERRSGSGTYITIERFRTAEPRDVRLWLDCGTVDDGLAQTLQARDALIENGYVEGPDFRTYIAQGARHHESAWAARLDQVFEFLFPESNCGHC